MAEKLKNGIGLAMEVYMDGEVKRLETWIAWRKTWNGKKELAFVLRDTEGNLYRSSGYSGGTTGFGNECSDKEDPEQYQLITKDPRNMARIYYEDNIRKENEKLAREKKRTEIVAQANTLPEMELFAVAGDYDWYIKRSEITYNSRFSSSTVFYLDVVRIEKGRDQKDAKEIYLKQFFRKDGVMLKKKVREATSYLLGESGTPEAAELLLNNAVAAERRFNHKIYKALSL